MGGLITNNFLPGKYYRLQTLTADKLKLLGLNPTRRSQSLSFYAARRIRHGSVIGFSMTAIDSRTYITVSSGCHYVDAWLNEVMECDQLHREEEEGPTVGWANPKMKITRWTNETDIDAWSSNLASAAERAIALFSRLSDDYGEFAKWLATDEGMRTNPVSEMRKRAIVACAARASMTWHDVEILLSKVPDDPPDPPIARAILWLLRRLNKIPVTEEEARRFEHERLHKFLDVARHKYFM